MAARVTSSLVCVKLSSTGLSWKLALKPISLAKLSALLGTTGMKRGLRLQSAAGSNVKFQAVADRHRAGDRLQHRIAAVRVQDVEDARLAGRIMRFHLLALDEPASTLWSAT